MNVPPRLGPYTLQAKIGEGGMGAVYRAHHATLDVVRAVKVLRAARDAHVATRFAREADTLGRVTHPNLVRVHEAGSEAGFDWFAMDLVEGPSLGQVLREGALPLDRALDVAAQTARGVAALHAAGVVHRDLKPQNVVVDSSGRAVVIDLGVAIAPDRDQRLTVTGQLVGTPFYMAPEQLDGRGPTPRTDVHALGLLLFELVTAEVAFGGTTSVHEVVGRIMARERPRPSDVVPDLPAALDDLVARAAAFDPAARFADAGALADAIDAVRRDPGPTGRGVRLRRRLRVAAAGGLIVALFVAFVALASRPGLDVEPAPSTTTGSVPTRVRVVEPAEGAATWEDAIDLVIAADGLDAPASLVVGSTTIELAPGATVTARAPLVLGRNELPLRLERGGRALAPAVRARVERRAAPAWFHAARARPPLAVAGVEPTDTPGRYVNTRDGSLLCWVPPGGGLERGVFLGVHEVTNDQLERFWAERRRTPADVPDPLEGEVPAPCDWFEAQAYCQWAGARLPSDLEWSRAAAGDDGRRFPWGAGVRAAEDVGLRADGQEPALGPHPVSAFPADVGPFGHVGLAGNAREWVQDAAPGGDGPNRARVLRGGSLADGLDAALARQSAAPVPSPGQQAFIGFRLCLSDHDPPRVPDDQGWSVEAGAVEPRATAVPANFEPLMNSARLRHTVRLPRLDLRFGHSGPGRALGADPDFPTDWFVLECSARPRLPAGRWIVLARSDDGVRVWADGALIIDCWGRADLREATLELDEPRAVELRVEYFEAGDLATLAVLLAPD